MNKVKNAIKRLALSSGYVIKRSASHSSGSDFVEDTGRLIGKSGSPIVFDVGANVGQTARRFRAEIPSARIYSFEPVRNVYEMMRQNLTGDSLQFCFNIALGNEKGEAKIYKNVCSELNSFKQQQPGMEACQAEVVKVDTLDSVCAQHGISTIEILKTDTEGFDLEVLRGGKGLIESERIKTVVAEATFGCDDMVHTSFFKLSEFLFGYGFSIMSMYDIVFIPGSGRISHFNVAFVHKSLRGAIQRLENIQ
jgi:FkbM family methyltransferase